MTLLRKQTERFHGNLKETIIYKNTTTNKYLLLLEYIRNPEAVSRRSSVKNIFFKVWQNSQKNTFFEVFFNQVADMVLPIC